MFSLGADYEAEERERDESKLGWLPRRSWETSPWGREEGEWEVEGPSVSG